MVRSPAHYLVVAILLRRASSLTSGSCGLWRTGSLDTMTSHFLLVTVSLSPAEDQPVVGSPSSLHHHSTVTIPRQSVVVSSSLSWSAPVFQFWRVLSASSGYRVSAAPRSAYTRRLLSQGWRCFAVSSASFNQLSVRLSSLHRRSASSWELSQDIKLITDILLPASLSVVVSLHADFGVPSSHYTVYPLTLSPALYLLYGPISVSSRSFLSSTNTRRSRSDVTALSPAHPPAAGPSNGRSRLSSASGPVGRFSDDRKSVMLRSLSSDDWRLRSGDLSVIGRSHSEAHFSCSAGCRCRVRSRCRTSASCRLRSDDRLTMRTTKADHRLVQATVLTIRRRRPLTRAWRRRLQRRDGTGTGSDVSRRRPVSLLTAALAVQLSCRHCTETVGLCWRWRRWHRATQAMLKTTRCRRQTHTSGTGKNIETWRWWYITAMLYSLWSRWLYRWLALAKIC